MASGVLIDGSGALSNVELGNGTNTIGGELIPSTIGGPGGLLKNGQDGTISDLTVTPSGNTTSQTLAAIAHKSATPSPLRRVPSYADDSSRGYNVQDITNRLFASRWHTDSNSWICEQNSAGFGAWLRNPSAFGYPGAGLGLTGALFMGGTLQMVPGYTGPAINVVAPSSGANKDVGFLSDGTLDESSLWSFMGTDDHLEVATIYDQTGNANHITQTTAANRYVLVPGARLGRAVALINDSENFGPAVKKWMAIPNTLSIAAGGAVTAAAVISIRNYNTSVAPITLIGSDSKNYSIDISQSAVSGLASTGAAIAGSGLNLLGGSVAAFTCAGTGTSAAVWYNGYYGIYGNSAGAGWAGGFLGKQSSTANARPHEFAGLVVYSSSVLPPGSAQSITANLEKFFGLPTQIADMLVLDGDSITYGYGCSYNQNYPRQMQGMLSHDFAACNVGFFGQESGARLAAQPNIIKYLSAANQNVWVEWIGTNDIAANVPLATMQSNLSQIITNAKSAGCKTVAVTALPRGTFTSAQEAQRQSWNAWINQGGSGADIVADVASDPTMGNYANNPVGGGYYIDTIHPTSLGYSFVAPIIARAINSLVI